MKKAMEEYRKFNSNKLNDGIITIKPCICGEKPEIFAYYSTVYERIHGFAECKKCGKKIWGKVSFDTCDVNTSHPNFPAFKHNAYSRVEESIVEEWNKHN